LPPDSLTVLAQDRAALLIRFPTLDPDRVRQVSNWASLNNSDDSSGVADLVVLREPDATLVDRVAYSAAGVLAGLPLELGESGLWQPASDPAGTPLRPPMKLAALARHFQIEPRRVRADGETQFGWSLPWSRARVALELYDMAGRRVARPRAESLAPGRSQLAWTPRGLRGGVYLAVLRARPETGDDTMVETVPLRIEGGP
jgi:hypothetical protein